MLKEKEESEVYLRQQLNNNDIIDGRRVDEERVELICDENVYYCVLKCAIKEDEITFDIL